MMSRDQSLFAITRILENHGHTVGYSSAEEETLCAKQCEDSYVFFEITKEKDDVYATAHIECVPDMCRTSLENMLKVSHETLCAAQAIVELERLGLFREAQRTMDLAKTKMLLSPIK